MSSTPDTEPVPTDATPGEPAPVEPVRHRRLPGAGLTRAITARLRVQPVAAIGAYFLAQGDDLRWLLAVSYTGFLINLINLIPLPPLDGGRVTAVLSPVVNRLNRAGLHRTLATAIVLLGGLVVFGLVGWFVVQQITSHASQLSDQVVQVSGNVTNWLKTGPLKLKDSDINSWQTQISNALKKNQGEVLSGALDTAKTLVEFVGGALLTVFSTFFLLRDGQKIWGWAVRLLPRTARDRVDSAGLTVAGALCVAVTFLEHGATTAIIVAIVIIALVQAEGHLLQPIIMSRAVHIHPLAVVLAVATGTLLYGIVGALIAVPLAAFGNSFIRGLWGEPRNPPAEAEPANVAEAVKAHTDPPPPDPATP